MNPKNLMLDCRNFFSLLAIVAVCSIGISQAHTSQPYELREAGAPNGCEGRVAGYESHRAGETSYPDSTTSFNTFWSAAQGKPFIQQIALWDREVEAPQCDLYSSVVWEKQHRQDWLARKQRLLKARFAVYPTLAYGINAEDAHLRRVLTEQIPRLRRLFPSASLQPPIRILVAPTFDAKSDLLADGGPVLVFAVDTLLLENADLGIVVPHELFHLYHSQHVGFKNDGVMPGVPLTIPLFEEGLAVYVSGELSPGHNDGELLLQDDLGKIDSTQLPEVARCFLADSRFKAIDDENPTAFKKWFNAAETAYQRHLPNRTGYWLGLQVIRYLRKSTTLEQIAKWTPEQADKQVMVALRAMGKGSDCSL